MYIHTNIQVHQTGCEKINLTRLLPKKIADINDETTFRDITYEGNINDENCIPKISSQ